MNRKVKVIRKAIQPQFPISGGPPQMVLTGGGGGGPRKKQSLPVRILGGAGSLAGGGLGALGALAGRHRSAGGLLQGMVSGAATGSALGRGLGEKAGGLVGVGGPKVASAARYLAAKPSDRVVSDLNRAGAKAGNPPRRLRVRGKSVEEGGVTDSPRTTDASAVSDNNVNRVLGATELGNVRVLGPGESVDFSPRSPVRGNPLDVAVTETGNPLDMNAESELNRRAIEQQMNRTSGPVGVVDTHPVQSSLFDSEFNPTIAASPIGQAGIMAASMIQPVAAGAPQEIAADEEAAESQMNLDPRAKVNTGTGKVTPLERRNSPLAGTSADTPTQNQRMAQQQIERLQMLNSEIEMNRAAGERGNSFAEAFPDYIDRNALVNRGEPMDIAFRLLKMMSFYR